MQQPPSPTAAQGFLLLTLPNAKLSAPFLNPPQQTGLLALQCVTIPLSKTDSPATNPFSDSAASERDVWLVLKMNNAEFPLSAADPIQHSRANRTYTFRAPEGPYIVSFPPPNSTAESEDLETFEVLLSQYGVLRELDGPEKGGEYGNDVKGKLILVDEDDGEMVGTLGDQYKIREDPNVMRDDKTPVIVEMPEEGQQELYVHSVNPDEQDFILRSAQFISRGIIGATDLLGKGMGMASSYYVKNSQPNPTPMVFSENAKANIRRIHHVSGMAVQVSSKTTGMIHSLIDRAADKVGGSKSSGAGAPPPLPARPGDRSRSAGQQPPPLPPRKRMLNRLLMSTNLILTTIENSAQQLVGHATDNLATGLGHKYGAEMDQAVRQIGDSVRNVGVVYVDMRGCGRRALIKRAGKRVIKGRMGKKEVVFGGEQPQDNGYYMKVQTPASTGGYSPGASSSKLKTM